MRSSVFTFEEYCYRVCEFAKLTPVQLLEETEKAVGDPQLPEQHRALIDKSRTLKHVELSLEKNEGTLNQLKERNAELEKDVERVRQRDELIAKVRNEGAEYHFLRPSTTPLESRSLYGPSHLVVAVVTDFG
ncbi:structural maintenance of chromosomes protein 5-like [Trifolium pratense]|uniref:Structural maintenance of chromosomes protein 5-like n=1 Tax=Trifolium pratense TaxID=57577 RepID=A0A2K3PP82_TRIPR|nr:structural maintenance of chromosomes protein 5-like [Trifolium pratense]